MTRFRDMAVGFLAFTAGLVLLGVLTVAGVYVADSIVNGPGRRAECAQVAAREGSARWELRGRKDCVIEGALGIPVTVRVG